MNGWSDDGRGRAACRLAVGTVIGAGVVMAASQSASAATTATFTNGVLTVFGDSAANNIEISRNAAGTILVNGGAVAVVGGTPTVANTTLIQVFGLGGNDVITLDEANGALPRAEPVRRRRQRHAHRRVRAATSSSARPATTRCSARAASTSCSAAAGNDTLTGGDADDQAFGESGDDRMIWNPGDDTDLNEGGDGIDTVEVNGGNGAEQFTTTANGTRVRFDRVNPAPFAIDIGTSENLVLNANGGDDTFSATGNLAALITITVDGGAGNDTILGSNGVDVLLGGDGNDFVDGQQGNDVALLGAGDDTFQWDPGDGSDTSRARTAPTRWCSTAAAPTRTSTRLGQRRSGCASPATSATSSWTPTTSSASTSTPSAGSTPSPSTTCPAPMSSSSTPTSPPSAAADDAAADNVIVNGTNGDDVVLVTGQDRNAQVTGLPAAGLGLRRDRRQRPADGQRPGRRRRGRRLRRCPPTRPC